MTQAKSATTYIDMLDQYQKDIAAATTKTEKNKIKSDFWEKFRKQMKEVVEDNDCLKARKCMLVPYKADQTGGAEGKEKSSNVSSATLKGSTRSGVKVPAAKDAFGKLGNASTGGCCPGQTGHHILPESWLSDCPAYTKAKHNQAPTVCAEGVGHSDGTHGTFHTPTDLVTKAHLGQTLTIDKAIDLAQQGHNNAVVKDFGHKWLGLWDHCDPDCIQAQLKAFYKDLGCEPTVKDKVGNEGSEQTNSGSGEE